MENLLIDTEYPYGCDTYTIEQIKSELHLVKLCEIYSSDIDREKDNYKKFTETIDSKAKGKHLWALFGSNNGKNWVPIQVASVYAQEKDVRREIKCDFERMQPPSKYDVREWKSYYHGSVIKVKEGLDVVCQKYQTISAMFQVFIVMVYDDEEKIHKTNGVNISKFQEQEIRIAKRLEPLIWNPAVDCQVKLTHFFI